MISHSSIEFTALSSTKKCYWRGTHHLQGCIDRNFLNKEFWPFGVHSDFVPISSRLRPNFVPITSRLRPDYVLITSRCPDFVPMSRFRPDCVLIASQLRPDFVPISSWLFLQLQLTLQLVHTIFYNPWNITRMQARTAYCSAQSVSQTTSIFFWISNYEYPWKKCLWSTFIIFSKKLNQQNHQQHRASWTKDSLFNGCLVRKRFVCIRGQRLKLEVIASR